MKKRIEFAKMSYDIIVIGSGQAGITFAQRTVAAGLKTVIVENDLVGGDCHYWACVPSKALLRSGHALRAAQHVSGLSEAISHGIDTKQVLEHRNKLVDNWIDDEYSRGLKAGGIEILRGRGEITGVRSLQIVSNDGNSQVITANYAVVVATGSGTTIPDIKGIQDVKHWDSRGGTSAQQAPNSLLIIGGGAVGCEMATAWSTFGSKVTLATRKKLLENMEPFAGEMLKDALTGLGVDVRLGITPVSAAMSNDSVIVHFDDGSVISAQELLFATGRTPNTSVGLESINLTPNGFLHVDDTLLIKHETNVVEPWIYAIGDVNGRAVLQHQGRYQARVAADAIIARAKGLKLDTRPWSHHVATADKQSVAQVIFTDPEVASVGLTESAARKKGYEVKTVEYELGKLPGAILRANGYKGRAKAVVDEQRKVLLGMTIVGPDVADLLQSATIAIVGEVPLERLWHAVPSFPTVSEVWLHLLEAYGM